MAKLFANFHVHLFARPVHVVSGPRRTVDGIDVATVMGPTLAPLLLDACFDCDFQQAFHRLLELPATDIEPDGFFVRSGVDASCRWRLSGHLYEYQQRLHRFELNGNAPTDEVAKTIAVLQNDDWIAEFVHFGVFVEPQQFWTWLGAPRA